MSNTEDKPIQLIRDSQICVSYTVRSALNLVSQAQGLNNPDALAEIVLLGWLTDNHPCVMNHLQAKRDMDKAFRVELKKRLNPDPFEPLPSTH